MKGKNAVRFILLSIFILYTTLYIMQAFGYYEYSNRKTNQLTEEAVERFEQDLKEGKQVKASDYIKKENDYNNNLSKLGLKVSEYIEDGFDGIMGFIFKQLNNTVNG